MLCWGGGGSTFSSSLPLFHTSTTSKMAEACFCIPILILEFNFKEIFRLHNTRTKKKKKTFEKIPIDYRNEINNGSFAFIRLVCLGMSVRISKGHYKIKEQYYPKTDLKMRICDSMKFPMHLRHS